VALESNPETSSPKRILSFSFFYSKLQPSLQYELLRNFLLQPSTRLETIPACQFVYHLCVLLSESFNTIPPSPKGTAVDFKIWLSKLREEANLRPELQDSVEPNVDAFDSSSIDSKGFLLERLGELWNTSVNYGTSTTGGSIRSISDYEFQLRDFESAYAEVSGAAVVSPNRVQFYSYKIIHLPATRKAPSDDWDSWSTTSNSAAPKSNIVPISGGNDDWSTSADAWGASKGTNAGCNQSDGWGSTETVKSSWTSGYKASRDGRGSKRKKKVKEGHMSYNCPINPNRGRGGGRGSGRGGGTLVCFKVILL
jgi:hypothetical protein